MSFAESANTISLQRALRLCARYRDLYDQELADKAGIPDKSFVAYALEDRTIAKVTDNQRKIIHALGYKTPQEVIAAGTFIEYSLGYYERFTEIFLAYRKKIITQCPRGMLTDFMRAAHYAGNSKKIPGETWVMHSLQRIGFESMHELIEAAGLSKKFPPPEEKIEKPALLLGPDRRGKTRRAHAPWKSIIAQREEGHTAEKTRNKPSTRTR